MPVIPVNRVVDPKRIIGKKWRVVEEERHKGLLTQKKRKKEKRLKWIFSENCGFITFKSRLQLHYSFIHPYHLNKDVKPSLHGGQKTDPGFLLK
jgi:hypothetical protein